MSYVNGSDMLLYIGGKAVGHCTTHSAEMSSDTKEHQVKPTAATAQAESLWKGKSVTALSISLSAEGLIFDTESERSYMELVDAWQKGKSVTCKCMKRAASETPYLAGSFVIKSLKRDDPAQDDAKYSISLENDGAPTTLEGEAFTEVA